MKRPIAIFAALVCAFALSAQAALAAGSSTGGASTTGTTAPSGGAGLGGSPAKSSTSKSSTGTTSKAKSKSSTTKSTKSKSTASKGSTTKSSTDSSKAGSKSTTTSSTTGSSTPAGGSSANPAPPTAQTSGTIFAINGSAFTILGASRQMSVFAALTAAANALTTADLPYVWGGGHAEAGVPSTGIAGGPGANGKTIGFDCSGSVAAVLSGGGVWTFGDSVPADNGVISELLSEHLIARGAASGTDAVNLYDDPGVHIFMSIGGRFFGTSDGGDGNASQPNDGAGWLDDGAPDATNKAFKAYHVLPAVLSADTSYVPALTLQAGTTKRFVDSLAVGDGIDVTYSVGTNGALTAQDVSSAS